MSQEDILLQMNPHTKAKHAILESYLKAWFPIMSKWNQRIVYLDGFAGSGEYDDGSLGSPIIALEVAKNHMLPLAKEVIFNFIEKEKRRYDHLTKLMDRKYHLKDKENGIYAELPSSFRVHIELGDFNTLMDAALRRTEQKGASLAPLLAFIDPFGYSTINIHVLSRILSYTKCELLITYMMGFLDRFAYDVKHRESIKKAFLLTDEELEKIISVSNREEREKHWLALLRGRLLANMKKDESVKSEVYHLSFRAMDHTNNTMYYLVFFTKHPKGVEVMKNAMFDIGVQGEYVFSDYNFDPIQTSLWDYSVEKAWLKQAAEHLYREFKGKTLRVSQIEKYVCLRTPWIWRVGILRNLEETNKIEVTEKIRPRFRRFTYPPDALVTFK